MNLSLLIQRDRPHRVTKIDDVLENLPMPILVSLQCLAVHAQTRCMANLGDDIHNLTNRQQFLRGPKSVLQSALWQTAFLVL